MRVGAGLGVGMNGCGGVGVWTGRRRGGSPRLDGGASTDGRTDEAHVVLQDGSPRVCRAETTETVCVAGDSYVSFTFTL